MPRHHIEVFRRVSDRLWTWRCSCGAEGKGFAMKRDAENDGDEHAYYARQDVARGAGGRYADELPERDFYEGDSPDY